jgi:3-methyladenine DNA glycosylase AlkD
MKLSAVRAAVRKASNVDDATHLLRFFKTGPGQYGEGDRFRGIRTPVLRAMARDFVELSHDDTLELLQSAWHEERLLALMLMVNAHAKGDSRIQAMVFKSYLAHTRFINNWDLVDTSAAGIVGPHAGSDDPRLLSKLAHSRMLWERRIAIVSTFHHIKRHDFGPTLLVADLLLADPHDLIHKATGWMLREVGKRDLAVEEAFLLERYDRMPRTMLRYAIERFPEMRRKAYLAGTASKA